MSDGSWPIPDTGHIANYRQTRSEIHILRWRITNMARLRTLLLITVLSLPIAVLASCASGGVANDGLLASGERKRVLAPIEAAELVVRESFPPRYAVRVTSGLPSGCAAFDRIELKREGRNLDLTVWNMVPADDSVVCTMIYAIARNTAELGSDFAPGRTYTVRVNGEAKITFTAR